MRNKAVWIVLGVVVVAIIAIVAVQQTRQPKEEKVIKIGVLLPLTGPAAQYGEDALCGTRTALAEYERDKRLRYKYQLVVEDSKSSPRDGTTAFQKLVDLEGLRFVVGDILSGVVMSIAPVANSRRVLVFAPGASTPALDNKDDYIIRSWMSDRQDAAAIARYIAASGIKRVFVIYVNNEYGKSLAEAFAKSFSSSGNQVLGLESYSENVMDYRSIIVKAKSLRPDAYYLIGYANQTGTLTRQLGENNALRTALVFTNLSADDPQYVQIAGAFADGVSYSSPAFDPDNPTDYTRNFIQNFRLECSGKMPGIAAAHAYDTTKLLIDAIETNDGDLERVRRALCTVDKYPGVSGTTSINRFGDALKEIFIKTIHVKGNQVERHIRARFTFSIKEESVNDT